jgi:hypothetical protein
MHNGLCRLGAAGGKLLLLLIAACLLIRLIPFWFAAIMALAGIAGACMEWRRRGSKLAWSLLLTAFALAELLPWPAPAVVGGAERIAAGAPYCIQVAQDADYREARSWSDFAPANMQATQNGVALQFHAILAIGSGPRPEIYNWSYRSMSWRDATQSRAPPVISCRPQAGFARALPLVALGSASAPDKIYLRLLGRAFSIPAAYEPWAHASSNPSLRLTIDAPGFARASCPGGLACRDRWLTIYLFPASVMRWLDGPATDETRLVEAHMTAAGEIRTRIDCHGPSHNLGLNCTQHFLFDGALFQFDMRETELSDWRAIQARFIALFQDLQAVDGAQP